jgi:hypothetical protein
MHLPLFFLPRSVQSQSSVGATSAERPSRPIPSVTLVPASGDATLGPVAVRKIFVF